MFCIVENKSGDVSGVLTGPGWWGPGGARSTQPWKMVQWEASRPGCCVESTPSEASPSNMVGLNDLICKMGWMIPVSLLYRYFRKRNEVIPLEALYI